MRQTAAVLILWILALEPTVLTAQERPPAPPANSRSSERIRASLLVTPSGSEIAIDLRNGTSLKGTLVRSDDRSFDVWVVADEKTSRILKVPRARIEKKILYEDVVSVRGAADVSNLPDSLAYRMRLRDTVYVRTASGASLHGRVDDFDGDVLRLNHETLSISGTHGEKIERLDLRIDDSLRDGVLIGTGISTSLWVLACVSAPEGECGGGFAVTGTIFYAGVGAGLGALFDSLKKRRELIYLAPSSPTSRRLDVVPVWTRNRRAVLLSLSF
jgi:small nuclear ribonucleoprotein (snRNP)-like protein